MKIGPDFFDAFGEDEDSGSEAFQVPEERDLEDLLAHLDRLNGSELDSLFVIYAGLSRATGREQGRTRGHGPGDEARDYPAQATQDSAAHDALVQMAAVLLVHRIDSPEVSV